MLRLGLGALYLTRRLWIPEQHDLWSRPADNLPFADDRDGTNDRVFLDRFARADVDPQEKLLRSLLLVERTNEHITIGNQESIALHCREPLPKRFDVQVGVGQDCIGENGDHVVTGYAVDLYTRLERRKEFAAFLP